MRSIRTPLCLACTLLLVLVAMSGLARSQVSPRPQLYAIRNVRLAPAADAPRSTLILRDGRIESVQDAAVEPPAGARVVDAKGMLALPAFIDAYTQTGCATPTPAADRDAAPKASSEALVDMREANRKGIQPAFRVADAFKLEAEAGKKWRGSGFGSMLSAPAGQYLAGQSALATTRDAPTRDVLVDPVVFDHAGFQAPGPGYPGTLMGAIAQLRQFFLDAKHQRDLLSRREMGKAGPKPPFDADLEAVGPVLLRKRRLVCEADSAGDIERWIRLGDEFGFDVAVSGGRDAWKRAAVLKKRSIPVILTLEWGEEVDDPHAKDKDKKKDEAKPDAPKSESSKSDASKSESQKPEPPKSDAPKSDNPNASLSKTSTSKADAPKPDAASDKPAPAESPAGEKKPPEGAHPETADSAKKREASSQEPAKSAAPAADWTFQEALRVREEKRRLWEETRDDAIRLSEAGVSLAFGTGHGTPKDLLDRVRTLVGKGLPADRALAALTSDAAALLGLGKDHGRIEAGFTASIAIWTQDPLTSKDAKVAWLFVDGFPYEFDVASDTLEGKPDAGVDATGTWALEFDNPRARPATAELKMDKDGAVRGTIRFKSPNDETERSGDFEGKVAGKKIRITGRVKFGNFEADVVVEGEIEKDDMKGTALLKFPNREDSRAYKASRKSPKTEDE